VLRAQRRAPGPRTGARESPNDQEAAAAGADEVDDEVEEDDEVEDDEESDDDEDDEEAGVVDSDFLASEPFDFSALAPAERESLR
jgi:hypothetical protein